MGAMLSAAFALGGRTEEVRWVVAALLLVCCSADCCVKSVANLAASHWHAVFGKPGIALGEEMGPAPSSCMLGACVRVHAGTTKVETRKLISDKYESET